MGIIPRISEDIFEHIFAMDENLEFHIKVSLNYLICHLLQLELRIVFSSNSQKFRVEVRQMGGIATSDFGE